MKIKLIRKLDYWVGVPLCFLLKIIDCILKLLPLKKKEALSGKILLIKLSEMGAIILTLPLIKKIRRKNPQMEIFFLTFKSNLPLIEVLDILPLRNIFVLREDSLILFLFDVAKAIKKIKKEKIDIVLDLEFFSRFTAILTYLSGAGKRIGFYRYTFEGLYRGNLLTHNIQYNPLLHTAKMYLSFAEVVEMKEKHTPEFESKVEDKEVVFSKPALSPRKREEMRDKLKNFNFNKNSKLYLLNLGESNLPLRTWPIKNFILLSQMLLEDGKNGVIVVGSKDFNGKAKELIYRVNDKRCINLAGKTNMLELLALFEIADTLIINDCGLAHLASLTSIRKIILFGPESPHLFKPLDKNTRILYLNLPCSPCFSVFNHRRSACKDNRCLKLIKVEEVYNIIKRKKRK